MNMIHNIIKMNLVDEGYLPNYPYHMISDTEMCDAFLNESENDYFHYMYPLVKDSLQTEYDTLVSNIQWHLDQLKSSMDDGYTLPDWVYSYMLGAVVSVHSTQRDVHDLLVLMNVDNLYDEFTPIASESCYNISKSWLDKLPRSQMEHRSPTMFGEPHVIKSLRLTQVEVSV